MENKIYGNGETRAWFLRISSPRICRRIFYGSAANAVSLVDAKERYHRV